MSDEIEIGKASPLHMRQALLMVDSMKLGGLSFIPIPVLNDSDRDELLRDMGARLELLESIAEEVKGDG